MSLRQNDEVEEAIWEKMADERGKLIEALWEDYKIESEEILCVLRKVSPETFKCVMNVLWSAAIHNMVGTEEISKAVEAEFDKRLEGGL